MKTIAQKGTGIEELTAEIMAHRDFLFSGDMINEFLRKRNEVHFLEILKDSMIKNVMAFMEQDDTLNKVVDGMLDHTKDPYSAAEEVLNKLLGKTC
jgi:LAO/AO transport system kinase